MATGDTYRLLGARPRLQSAMNACVQRTTARRNQHPDPLSNTEPGRCLVTFYRRLTSILADELEEVLTEMVIAHEVVTIDNEGGDSALEDVPDLPALRDSGEVVTGEEALHERIDMLRDVMAKWDRFQSDACYIEDDGTIC